MLGSGRANEHAALIPVLTTILFISFGLQIWILSKHWNQRGASRNLRIKLGLLRQSEFIVGCARSISRIRIRFGLGAGVLFQPGRMCGQLLESDLRLKVGRRRLIESRDI